MRMPGDETRVLSEWRRTLVLTSVMPDGKKRDR